MHACVGARACVSVCVGSVCACERVCVCASMRTCLHAYMRGCVCPPPLPSLAASQCCPGVVAGAQSGDREGLALCSALSRSEFRISDSDPSWS